MEGSSSLTLLKGSHHDLYPLMEALSGKLKSEIRTCPVFPLGLEKGGWIFHPRWIFPHRDRAVFIIHSGDVCWVPECVECLRWRRCAGGDRRGRPENKGTRESVFMPAHSAKKQKTEFTSTCHCYVTLRSNFTSESPCITACMLISKPRIHQWRPISDLGHALSKTVQYWSR